MALFEEHHTSIRLLCTYKHQPNECSVSSLHTDQKSGKKRKMNKYIKNRVFLYLDFKIQEIFPVRLTILNNKLLLLHSFVLGSQLSQEIVH